MMNGWILITKAICSALVIACCLFSSSPSFAQIDLDGESLRDVATGLKHSLVLMESGELWGAGSSAGGQLGYLQEQNEPRVPLGVIATSVSSIAAGTHHSMFIKEDGSLWAAGSNNRGQLGDGTVDDRFEFVQILESGARQVSCGDGHSLVLMEDGSAWGTGSNIFGQLGDGTNQQRHSLVRIFETGVRSVHAGDYNSLFLLDSGALWGCGGSVNLAASNLGQNTPIELFPSGVESASAGRGTLAVKDDGSLWGIGYNQNGELGVGDAKPRLEPDQIVDAGVSTAAIGRYFSLFIKDDGSLWHTGFNKYNEEIYKHAFGVLETQNEYSYNPHKIVHTGVAGVWGWSDHAFVERDDGSLWSIGLNEDGQLGVEGLDYAFELVEVFSSNSERENAIPMANPGTGYIGADGDGDGVGRVMLDGSASTDDWQIADWHWSWPGGETTGIRAASEFNVGITEVTLTVTDTDGATDSTEVAVVVRPQSGVAQVSVGWRLSLCIKEDGSLWGTKEAGVFGRGFGPLEERFSLIEPSGVIAASAGEGQIMYIKDGGEIWVAGSNSGARIGLGNVHDYIWKTTKLVANGGKAVSATRLNSYFVLDDGSLWGMGFSHGGVPKPGEEGQFTPVKLVESGVDSVVSGVLGRTRFLKTDGSLWAVESHEFADESDSSPLPAEVVSGGVTDVAVGERFTAFLKEDGSLWAAGEIYGYDTGQGRVSTPVEIIDSGVADVEAGWNHYFARMDDGSLLGVGRNDDDVLGKPVAYEGEFVEILSSRVKTVAAGEELSLFVANDGSLWGSGELDAEFGMYEFPSSRNAVRILASPHPGANSAPVANAGPDLTVLVPDDETHASVFLDGFLSRDDWQVSEYRWSWDDRESYGQWLSRRFPVGETQVSLTVTDYEGLSSVDELTVQVLDSSFLNTWLLQYYTEGELDSLGTMTLESDPDLDGLSNRFEFLAGFDPSSLFDPRKESVAEFVADGDRLLLMSANYSPELKYTLWGLGDDDTWVPMGFPTLIMDGRFGWIIPNGARSVLRVQIDTLNL